MMYKKTVNLVIFLLLSSILFADGLPFNNDKTHLIGSVIVIKLTNKQQKQISQTRFLDLNDSQLEHIQNTIPKFPRKIEILTNRFDDCACGLGYFGVWFKIDEIEIPYNLKAIEYYKKMDDKHKEANNNGSEEQIAGEGPLFRELIIDFNLNLYFLGNKVSEKDFWLSLQKLIKENSPILRRPDNNKIWISVDTPPILPSHKEIKLISLIKRLKEGEKGNNIDLFYWGFRN